MSRPGDKITLKTMAATAKMRDQIREIELKERSSKSLLANVLGKKEITFIKTFFFSLSLFRTKTQKDKYFFTEKIRGKRLYIFVT